ENDVKHNTIDSENPIKVSIFLNGQDELVVSNPIHAKIDPPDQNGIGLKNLSDRFELLLNKSIRFDTQGGQFNVYLPL
ncbi:MAG: histidine kinase, partial [Tannerella sp.]|nr:histidine kinase [Tannerella sp.]